MGVNVNYNMTNTVVYNHIFYSELKPIEELRDNKIDNIIK